MNFLYVLGEVSHSIIIQLKHNFCSLYNIPGVFFVVVIDTPDDEEMPKVSTKILKEQFEKSAQEKVLYSGKETMYPAKESKVM